MKCLNFNFLDCVASSNGNMTTMTVQLGFLLYDVVAALSSPLCFRGVSCSLASSRTAPLVLSSMSLSAGGHDQDDELSDSGGNSQTMLRLSTGQRQSMTSFQTGSATDVGDMADGGIPRTFLVNATMKSIVSDTKRTS